MKLPDHRLGILIAAAANFMCHIAVRAIPDFEAVYPGTLANIDILTVHEKTLIERAVAFNELS